MTQHKQSHRIKSHGRTSHQPTLHQNRSHHHHGTAEGSFTAKKWFGHRAGRSPCAHSIGKFFPCYIPLFSSETSAPGSPGNYLYIDILLMHLYTQQESRTMRSKTQLWDRKTCSLNPKWESTLPILPPEARECPAEGKAKVSWCLRKF